MVLLLLLVGVFALIGYAMDVKTGVEKTKANRQLTPDESWDMWTGGILLVVFVFLMIWFSAVA